MAKGGNVYIPMPKIKEVNSDIWSRMSVSKRKAFIRAYIKNVRYTVTEKKRVSLFNKVFGGNR